MTDAAEMAAYLREPRELFHGLALCVVKPETASQLSQVLSLCNESGVGVTPQGGNTGLVGGQTPDESGSQIVLSLEKLNAIREIDPGTDTITVEAGVTLAMVKEAADSVDRYFPLSLASEGSCTIGGNLATNAGGVHVIAYGSARDLTLGVEAALADGRIVSGLSKLRKDNTGYDLSRLFIGSEGTLAVITAATLKLFPRPRGWSTAVVAFADLRQALNLLGRAKSSAAGLLEVFEIIPRIALEMAQRHIPGVRDPFTAKHRWYALVEFASFSADSPEGATEFFVEAIKSGFASDVALAASLEHRADFWRLRETIPEAQKREGGSIKHDVSVPIDCIPAFVEEASRLVEALIPGARPVPFGHMGDGNIHFNISQPIGGEKDAFLARWSEANGVVHEVVRKFDGSISAEHGIGRLKRELLQATKDPVSLDVMRAIKSALDPKGILNPGKLL